MAPHPPVLYSLLVLCSGAASALRRAEPFGLVDDTTGRDGVDVSLVRSEDQYHMAERVKNATAVCDDPEKLGVFHRDRYWGRYVLSDLLVHPKTHYACGNTSHPGAWPDSLYCAYLRAYPADEPQYPNLQHLLEIVRNRTGGKSEKKGVAIHIRIGDVLEERTHDAGAFLKSYWVNGSRRMWNKYIKPLAHFRYIADHIKHHQHITLVGSVDDRRFKDKNWTQPFKRSCVYTHVITAYLEQRGHHVNIRVGHDPDDDTAFLVNSPVFVPSRSPYGELIASLVRMNGGKVLEEEGEPWY